MIVDLKEKIFTKGLEFPLKFLLYLFIKYRMVNDLSKITQGKHVIDTLNQTQQEMKLKTLGLECMVTIMRSLVDWCKDLRKDFEEQGMCFR